MYISARFIDTYLILSIDTWHLYNSILVCIFGQPNPPRLRVFLSFYNLCILYWLLTFSEIFSPYLDTRWRKRDEWTIDWILISGVLLVKATPLSNMADGRLHIVSSSGQVKVPSEDNTSGESIDQRISWGIGVNFCGIYIILHGLNIVGFGHGSYKIHTARLPTLKVYLPFERSYLLCILNPYKIPSQCTSQITENDRIICLFRTKQYSTKQLKIVSEHADLIMIISKGRPPWIPILVQFYFF